jgi:hypothetical protein
MEWFGASWQARYDSPPMPHVIGRNARRGDSALLTRTILGLLLSGALGGGAWGCAAEPPPQRPNLLLVTVDTLRADRLACYGGDPTVATGICSLASPGTRFAWAFSAA